MKTYLLLVWGFISTIILLFIVITYFLEIPNTIDGDGVLVNKDVVDYAATREGVIEFIQADNSKVFKNEILFVFENISQVQEINILDMNLKKIGHMDYKSLNKFGNTSMINPDKIGSVALPYVEFLTQLNTYLKFHLHNPYLIEFKALKNELTTIERTLQLDNNILENSINQLQLAKKNKEVDSVLFANRLINLDEWESSRMKYIQSINSKNSNHKLIDVQQKNQSNFLEEKQKVKVSMHIEENRLYDATVEKYVRLVNYIQEWNNINVIRAPFDGTIKYHKFWNKKDLVQKNEKLFVFAAKDKIEEIEIKINIVGAGKIKVGQKCLIELIEYPAKDYGMLEGRVKNIISLKQQNKDYTYSTYIRIIITKDGLTNYGNLINTSYSMPVHTQIILDNETLFNKIFKRIEKKVAPIY